MKKRNSAKVASEKVCEASRADGQKEVAHILGLG